MALLSAPAWYVRRTYTTLDEAIGASGAMLGCWQCMIMIAHCDHDRGLGYEE
jgi:hypothetical protein